MLLQQMGVSEKKTRTFDILAVVAKNVTCSVPFRRIKSAIFNIDVTYFVGGGHAIGAVCK